MHYLVTFTSREESQNTLSCAVRLAAATKASLTVLKVIVNPHAVGVVAELIATDEPFILANDEVEEVVKELLQEHIEAQALVRKVDNVAEGIISIAQEVSADLIFLGTRKIGKSESIIPDSDPVVDYVVDHSPINVVLVRPDKKN